MGLKSDFPHSEAYDVLRSLPKWQEMDEDKDKAGLAEAADNPKKRAAKNKGSRPTGKRAAALNDKIQAVAKELDAETPGVGGGGLEEQLGALAATLESFSSHMSMQMWEPEDRKEYLKTQVQIKKLKQQKELNELMQDNSFKMSVDATHIRINSGNNDAEEDELTRSVTQERAV